MFYLKLLKVKKKVDLTNTKQITLWATSNASYMCEVYMHALKINLSLSSLLALNKSDISCKHSNILTHPHMYMWLKK